MASPCLFVYFSDSCISPFFCSYQLFKQIEVIGKELHQFQYFCTKNKFYKNTQSHTHTCMCTLLRGFTLLPVPPLVFLVQSVSILFKIFFNILAILLFRCLSQSRNMLRPFPRKTNPPISLHSVIAFHEIEGTILFSILTS